MRSMRGKRGTRTWLAAFLATILLHVATLLAILVLRPFTPSPLAREIPEPIEFVFAPEPTPSQSDDPSFFSELPEDRGDEAPERADFLSNVDSRARDRAPGGGEEALPRLEGRSEAPHVRVDPGAPVPPVADAAEDPTEEVTRDQPAQEEPEAADEVIHVDRTLSEDPVKRLANPLRRAPAPVVRSTRRAPGVADFLQEAMRNPQGNAALTGDISLNTTAWEYAPWLQRFRRDFTDNWYAPYAYHLGLTEGWTQVELVVSPQGTLLRLEVLDEDGHPSLRQASVDAFEATAPFQPLPVDFPEETLVLRIRLVYPPVRR